MLGFRIADKVGALLAIVFFLFPLCQDLAAVSVAHFADEIAGDLFYRAVTERVHGDGERHVGEGIALHRPGQHGRLVAKPPEISEKAKYQQTGAADGDPKMSARNRHGTSFG